METIPTPEQKTPKNMELLQEVKEIIARFPYTQIALEEICAHDEWTLMHLKRCGNLAYVVSGKIGLNELERDLLVQSALSHDVGKYLSPKGILDKIGKFTEEDWEEMRKHPGNSADYLKAFNPIVAEIAKRHHLHQDNPYPENISGGSFTAGQEKLIDKLSIILAIVDKFETYSGERAHKRPEKFKDFLPKLRKIFSSEMGGKVIDVLSTSNEDCVI